MVPEKVKAELKRFLTPKQVEELSKQFDTYEKRVREAVKTFDVKGREAKAKGQEQLEKFTVQLKKTSSELEKQIKSFVHQESKTLNKGLNELFAYFRALSKSEPVKSAKSPAKSAKKSSGKSAGKSAKTTARKTRTVTGETPTLTLG